MSFFGFDQPNSLEDEKRKFLEGSLGGAQQEDLAVYTWGEESYDGLGDALQERGDELNDETFGGTGEIGKDFDFSSQAFLTDNLPRREPVKVQEQPAQLLSPAHQVEHAPSQQQTQANTAGAARTGHSLEAIWDDRSPFSVLPKSNANGGSRPAEAKAPTVPAPAPATSFSPFGLDDNVSMQQQAIDLGAHHMQGARTLEEIEAEMREAFAAQRISAVSPSHPPVLSQAQLRSTAAHRQLGQYGQGSTPPPRMHALSQSPRFQQQQQQHVQLLHQQQQQQHLQLLELQEQQQRQQLLELQEQLRLEELERQRQQQLQLRQAQLQAQAHAQAQYLHHQRQASSGTPPGDMGQRNQRYRSATPSRLSQQQQVEVPFQQNLQYLPRDIQMQQRLLAEMAQAEFLHSLQGSPVRDASDEKIQEMLRAEAMRKIMEAERMEEKRRRKLEKIRYMARYNDLMTQSDKDFITRIQVSQLVTQDPYADDFYAQVYGAVMRSRMGLNAPEALLKFSSGGGVGLGLAQVKGNSRRPSAMQRMEQQVERIVNNARLREKEKISLNSLQGALGKTAGRSYKAAPRQLLQVNSAANGASSPTLSHAAVHISKADAAHFPTTTDGEGAARAAAMMGKEALGFTPDGQDLVRKDPLTHRESLVILERLFDIIIEAETVKQTQAQVSEEDMEAAPIWEAELDAVVDRLWDGLRVMTPLETSEPHPFISLITPIKGKRMLPRATRYFDTQRLLTLLTLLVACSYQLDVIRDAHILDHLEDTRERVEVEAQTNTFLGSVMQSVLPVAATGGLRLISGLLALFLERNDVGVVARTKPGIALLTMFVSRVETMRQEIAAGGIDPEDMPTQEEWDQWQLVFDHMFQLLTPHWLFLFPSVRMAYASNITLANVPDTDHIDQPVWQLLAAVALHASVEQQQTLVASLRERILENVATANKGWVADEEERRQRIANVNIFLHALGLDASQISL